MVGYSNENVAAILGGRAIGTELDVTRHLPESMTVVLTECGLARPTTRGRSAFIDLEVRKRREVRP